MDLQMTKLIKLPKIVGVMHEADHAYSIQSTWRLPRLATDVPFLACVIDLPCTFTHYLELIVEFLVAVFLYLDCRMLGH